MSSEVGELRRVVQESLRIQRAGADTIDYVDASRALEDIVTRQNHVVFGRRGCGKTLLLGAVRQKVGEDVRVVYINCEDYKQHSFPNVLIEILDALFKELERNLRGWFGRKKRSRELIGNIRSDLTSLKERADETNLTVRETNVAEAAGGVRAGLTGASVALGVGVV